MEYTKEQKLLQDIIRNAWEDEGFKEKLIANPISAIESLTGQRANLPEGKTVVVRDQTDESVIYINIPAATNTDDMELNEEQLEIIAGGVTPTPPILTDPAANLSDIF